MSPPVSTAAKHYWLVPPRGRILIMRFATRVGWLRECNYGHERSYRHGPPRATRSVGSIGRRLEPRGNRFAAGALALVRQRGDRAPASLATTFHRTARGRTG